MSENKTNTYEGLFLFPQSATADLGASSEHILEHLEKVGANVISFRKWDDRRLAYPVKGNKRGVYFLGYFEITGDKIATLERNLLLSEAVLRFLITRADHLTSEQIEAAEGRAELADEIKLRSERRSDEAASSVRATTRSERDSEVEETAEMDPSDGPDAEPATEEEEAATS